MKTYKRIFNGIGIATVVITTFSFSTAAYAVAGKFQFVNGEVQVIDAAGKQRLAQKGGAIDAGETVSSTDNGFAQIKMEDGGFFAVRPDTQFKVDTFEFNGKEDGSEKGVFSLIKGSLRSVTGLIGKKHKDNYKINTATATIGIRGSGADVGHSNSLGTAVRTLFGGHSLTSNGKTLETGPGQTAQALPGQDPKFVPNFPFNSGTGANGQNNAGGSSSDKPKDKTAETKPGDSTEKPAVPVKATSTNGEELDLTKNTSKDSSGKEAPIGTTVPFVAGPAPIGSGGAAVGFDDGDGLYAFTGFNVVGTEEYDGTTYQFSSTIDSTGALTGWTSSETYAGGSYTQTLSLGSAITTVEGQDDSLGVLWGRWSEGYTRSYTWTYEGQTDGGSYSPVGGLAFITGSHITTSTELSNFASWAIGSGLRNDVGGVISGTYSLAPGNFPTLVNGFVSGSVTSALATVDFNNAQLAVSIAGSGGGFGSWQATGSGGFGSGHSLGLSGTCAGGAGACAAGGTGLWGNASGGFVGTQAQGLISTISLGAGGTDALGAAVYLKRGVVANPLPLPVASPPP